MKIIDKKSSKKKEVKKISRNNALKNTLNSKNIYTDKETNQLRKELKRKLTHSEYLHDDENDESEYKSYQKIKTNKAKIKKFKTKNEYEEKRMVKKETGGLRAHGNKAKIKKLHNDRNNTGVEYKNIVLQNSTYKQTTYNYYTNDVKRPVKMKTNQTLSSERRKNSHLQKELIDQ